jgi:hypothetical protein
VDEEEEEDDEEGASSSASSMNGRMDCSTWSLQSDMS